MPFENFEKTMLEAPEAGKVLTRVSDDELLPAKIQVASSPSCIHTPDLVPLSTLEHQLNMKFTETLWAPKYFLEASLAIRSARYSKRAICHHGMFMLVSMDGCGYGLFAKQHIPAHSFLFLYSGEYTSGDKPGDPTYRMSIADELFGYSDYVDKDPMTIDLYGMPVTRQVPKIGVIDAKFYRNFSAFAQHLPSKWQLDTAFIFIDERIKSQVACANVTTEEETAYVHGLAAKMFNTETDIPAGTIIGFNYGPTYWLNLGRQPYLFYKGGHPIDPKCYYPTALYLSSDTRKRFVAVMTENVFVALINRKDLPDFPYPLLLRKVIDHLGEDRLKAHMQCFTQLHPEVVLNYRTERFFYKYPSLSKAKCEKASLQSPSTETLEALSGYLARFGFKFTATSATQIQMDMKSSTPKTPLSFLK